MITGPDVEAVLITALKAQPPLVALVGNRISQQVQAGPWPAIALHVAGGTDLFEGADTHHRPILSLHAYGATSVEASLVARTCRSALRVIGNTTWTVHDAVIISTEIVSDIVWIPDTAFTPPQPHYTWTTAVVIRANL